MQRPDRERMPDAMAAEYDGAAAALMAVAQTVADECEEYEGDELTAIDMVNAYMGLAEVFSGMRPTRCEPENDFFRVWQRKLEQIHEGVE